jgi:hypothetical protein
MGRPPRETCHVCVCVCVCVRQTIDALEHTVENVLSVMSCNFVEDILALLKKDATAAKADSMTLGWL